MLKELLTSEIYQHTPWSLNPRNNHLCIRKSNPWHIFHWVRSEYSLSKKKIVCYHIACEGAQWLNGNVLLRNKGPWLQAS